MGIEDVNAYMRAVRSAARDYMEMGWSVVPLRLDDKSPLVKWTDNQTRRATAADLDEWEKVFGTFGLGVITGSISGIVILDCDNTDALDFAINEPGLDSKLQVQTTRGAHLYFKHPGVPVQNKVGGQGRDWPSIKGLDLRGDGGLVVVPPTVKFAKDGSVKHIYQWAHSPSINLRTAVEWLTPWPGIKAPPPSSGEWSFEDLKLAAVRTYGERVWDEAAARVKEMGRKMADGDGRNNWVTRYVGECVSDGMDETQVRVAVDQFTEEFFSEALTSAEVSNTIRSIIDKDRRTHPGKYAAQEKWENKTPERQAYSKSLRLITPSSLGELRKMADGQRFLVDPFIAPQSIVQVVGFNGHGKSMWLLTSLWAAALGQSFASGIARRRVRTLYLDFELSGATMNQRVEDNVSMFGEMSAEMAIWNDSVSDLKMPLNTAEGTEALGELLKETQPQIVVIDTVRSAFVGMEEKSPHAWVRVNNIAKTIRNAGCSVVIVHHRNKPGQNGMGREAGSTAQLTDIDTQIIITKVVEDKEQAQREAALVDSATEVTDSRGVSRTAFSYLRLVMPAGYTLKAVFEVSFGKLRQATDNHVTTYVGVAEDIKSGKRTFVSSKTPRQKTEVMAGAGRSVQEIAEKLQVPMPTVQRWVDEAPKKNGTAGTQ
jgi:DNA-binding NarL/FixJ family response regulator